MDAFEGQKLPGERPEHDIERWERELKAAGWKQKLIGVWSSPAGKLFHGPYYAWKVLTGKA
jgi:hypothetical protein